MSDSDDTTFARPSITTRLFVESDALALTVVWAMVLGLLGVPLLLECGYHFLVGNVDVGCWFGGLGALVVGFSGWKLVTAYARARREYVTTVAASATDWE